MKIALIEIGGSHDECLYSQIKILKSVENVHLTLICDSSLKEHVSYFDSIDKIEFVKKTKGFWAEWFVAFKIYSLYKKENFDNIIFNTAEGKKITKLLLLPFSAKTKFFGTLHNTNKIKNSTSQKLISQKIQKYFVLNDYLVHEKHKHIFASYYPIFFPNYPQANIEKPKDTIWVCIPGQVELKRRDYSSLFDNIEKTKLEKNIQFIFLGPCEHSHGDGNYIKERIKKLNLEKQCMLWDNFIDVTLFHTIAKNSDFLLPLIHPQHVSYSLYSHNISGAFNIAFAYKIPLLMEESFSSHLDFKDNSIFYNIDNMLSKIKKPEPNKKFYQEQKWSFDFQKEKYWQVIVADSLEEGGQ